MILSVAKGGWHRQLVAGVAKHHEVLPNHSAYGRQVRRHINKSKKMNSQRQVVKCVAVDMKTSNGYTLEA